MKVVAFMPAKGASTRIENKNLRLLDGKPLFLHTIEKLMSCDFVDEVYLDTESDEMIELASDSGCKVLKRDPALASNATDGHELFHNSASKCEGDLYIQVLCTSLFIEPSTLRRVEALAAPDSPYDSAVLVRREKQYLWNGDRPAYGEGLDSNSIDLPDTVIGTMGMYMMRADAARRLRRRIGPGAR
ncbi:MAG: NTP transferase domain-containing protein [Gammaproteobacteria bacterium]